MSVSRRYFPAIAEAWINRSLTGKPALFVLKAYGLEIECEITKVPDIELINNFSLLCDVEGENIDLVNQLNIECIISKIGDIQPINQFNIIVVATAA